MRAKEAVPDGEAQLRERTRRSEQKRLQESTAWLGWRKNWSTWGAIWPLASNQETLREPWTVVQSNCPNVFANFEPQNSSNIKRVNWSCSFVVDMSGSLFPMSLAFFVLCLFWYPGTPNLCASAENRGQALRSTAVQQHCHCLEGCSSRQSQIQSLCISRCQKLICPYKVWQIMAAVKFETMTLGQQTRQYLCAIRYQWASHHTGRSLFSSTGSQFWALCSKAMRMLGCLELHANNVKLLQ